MATYLANFCDNGYFVKISVRREQCPIKREGIGLIIVGYMSKNKKERKVSLKGVFVGSIFFYLIILKINDSFLPPIQVV